MSSLYLLGNTNESDAQRISILASASRSDDSLSPRSSVRDFSGKVSYQSIASIISHCNKPAASSSSSLRTSANSHTSREATIISHVIPIFSQWQHSLQLSQWFARPKFQRTTPRTAISSAALHVHGLIQQGRPPMQPLRPVGTLG